MVNHQVDQDAQSALPAALGKFHEVSQSAIAWIYPVVICDIVAIIPARGGLKRHQPYSRYTHPLQVVQATHQPWKVSNAVAVGIQVGGDRQAVNDGVLVPQIVNHEGSLSDCRRSACRRGFDAGRGLKAARDVTGLQACPIQFHLRTGIPHLC